MNRRRLIHIRRRVAPLRTAGRVLATVALLVLAGACAPIVVTDAGARADIRVTPRASGGVATVHVPEDRGGRGIDVRSDDGRTFRIPPGHYPPPGACRIWRPGVPPGQQDPPGACSDLEPLVPSGAVLVRG